MVRGGVLALLTFERLLAGVRALVSSKGTAASCGMATLGTSKRPELFVDLVSVHTQRTRTTEYSATSFAFVNCFLCGHNRSDFGDRFRGMSRFVVNQLLLVLERLFASGTNVVLLVGMDLLVDVFEDGK